MSWLFGTIRQQTIDIFSIQVNNTLEWMSEDLTDVRSAVVQVMAWCRQATSHYMNPYKPRSLMPYGVTGPQWVKLYNVETDLWWHMASPGHNELKCIECNIVYEKKKHYLMHQSVSTLTHQAWKDLIWSGQPFWIITIWSTNTIYNK